MPASSRSSSPAAIRRRCAGAWPTSASSTPPTARPTRWRPPPPSSTASASTGTASPPWATTGPTCRSCAAPRSRARRRMRTSRCARSCITSPRRRQATALRASSATCCSSPPVATPSCCAARCSRSMARDEPVTAPASLALEDDDVVDLSFAGPEPVAAAPWPIRLLDVVSAYLPLLMMAVLASGTWWLVRNAPGVDAPREAAPLRHEADYTMTRFVVQRFGSDGALRTEIEGERLRHFPDDNTLEIEQARIRAIGSDGVVTVANARKALANGDGSEVQLLGDAHVVRPAHGKE